MDEAWASDGLDEALASVCDLVEGDVQPLTIELSSEEGDYYEWNRNWETQNLNNGLFSESSNPSLADRRMDNSGESGEHSSTRSLPAVTGGEQFTSAEVSDWRCSSGKPVEFSSDLRASATHARTTSSGSPSDVPDSAPTTHKRRVLGEIFESNKRVRATNGEKEVSKEKKGMGRTSACGILSAAPAMQMYWRNGVFSGRSSRDLYQHCNGIVSQSQRFIHDIVPDSDGRRVAQLLEQLATTRKCNGLWMVTVHRRAGSPHKMELPQSLPSRSEAIEAALLLNAEYRGGPDRHAHIVHVCPWAGNYCRCRPLQNIDVKRRTRPSRPWRLISEEHFINLILYLMRHPRQLCLFEIGGAPVEITFGSGMYSICVLVTV